MRRQILKAERLWKEESFKKWKKFESHRTEKKLLMKQNGIVHQIKELQSEGGELGN